MVSLSARRFIRALVGSVAAISALLFIAGCGRIAGGSVNSYPLLWHIGGVDPRFNVSTDQVKQAVERAASLWEKAAGKQLFKYDDSQGISVQLVFDQRQDQLNADRAASQELDAAKKRLDQPKREEQAEMKRYVRARNQLYKRENRFQTKLENYNRQIGYWNSRGGVPEQTIQELDSAKADLAADKASIEESQQQVDDMRVETNRMVDSYNELAANYRASVQQYNVQFRSNGAQTIGEYVRTGDDVRVTVYAFEDTNHLAVVLAHELGHALGLEHVPGTGSIMSAVEKGTTYPNTLRLSDRDLHALHTLLGK
jgi:hypothetical protein